MKNLIQILLLTLSVFLGISAAALSAEDQITAAAKLLADDFKPNVVAIDRDVKVFHYAKNPTLDQDLPLSSEKFDHELLSNLNYFWQDEGRYPFYAAADPLISRDYGTVLIEITIKKGSHILNGYARPLLISSKTIAAIRVIEPSFTPGTFRTDSVLYFIPRKILAQAFKALDVEVVTYSWAASTAICSNVDATFLILGTPTDLAQTANGNGVIEKNLSVVGYTPSATDFSDPTKREAYARIERILYLGNRPPINHMISDSDIGTLSDAEKTAWRDQTFTCDNLHPTDYTN